MAVGVLNIPILTEVPLVLHSSYMQQNDTGHCPVPQIYPLVSQVYLSFTTFLPILTFLQVVSLLL